MSNRPFLRTQLGQASIASIAAMVLMVAFTSQMHAQPSFAAPAFEAPTLAGSVGIGMAALA